MTTIKNIPDNTRVVKTQRVGAAELVWRSRDQDVASTCVLCPRTGTGVSCYFRRPE